MKALEKKTGKTFGGGDNPLLVSVRSGSSMSMPGMMDTILNLGLNKTTLKGLIKQTGNARFGYDAYRRFIQLFGKIALGHCRRAFRRGDGPDQEPVRRFSGRRPQGRASGRTGDRVPRHRRSGIPASPSRRSLQATRNRHRAVFRSWNGKRAIDYRKQFKITREMANGTAVNICTMVFGNMGNDSGTGVGFTRNPGTGENLIYGEYLVNAQGEDVVAGIRTPKPIAEMEQDMPEIYRQLQELHNRLESHYKEVQDFEFTIEKGTLYCLQTRNGKMNARAMVRTSVEMFKEGLISKEKALMRIDPRMLEQLLVPQLAPDFKGKPLATGLPASPGAASGKIVFDADSAEGARPLASASSWCARKPSRGHPRLLPGAGHPDQPRRQDLARGGGGARHGQALRFRLRSDPSSTTSSAARPSATPPCMKATWSPSTVATARSMPAKCRRCRPSSTRTWKPCWLGRPGGTPEGDGQRRYARRRRKARGFGAMGIGLCRTERMFNSTDRLPIVQEMILAESSEETPGRAGSPAADPARRFQGHLQGHEGPAGDGAPDGSADARVPADGGATRTGNRPPAPPARFAEGGRGTAGNPEAAEPAPLPAVCRRPDQAGRGMEDFKDSHLEEDVIHKKEKTLKKVRALSEVNPMLGHRGVRLGITYPEIYEMQIKAILEAAALCAKEGIEVHPEIMVPQVATVEELKRIHSYVQRIHKVVELTHGINVGVKFGSMLEVVRACLRAGRMAEDAQFFSFGTNDLTQATFSFSREDAENKFLPAYIETGILEDNPFEVLDQKGVGELMKLAVPKGARPIPSSRSASAASMAAIRLDPFLPRHRADLRFLLRAARADRAPGCRAGATAGLGRRGRQERLTQGGPEWRR
jgi:pyruvate,orthophosphate dikinase